MGLSMGKKKKRNKEQVRDLEVRARKERMKEEKTRRP